MRDGRTLFEWLAQRDDDKGACIRTRSVVTHIGYLLNTRGGNAGIADDYGVPDFSNQVGALESGVPAEIELAIENVLARYEPRLWRPRVRLVGGERLELRFEISGALCEEGTTESSVRCEVRIVASGKVEMLPLKMQ